MWTKSLTYAQKQKLTTTLFYSVAVGAVAVVAIPNILPCPAVDRTRTAGRVYADEKDRALQHGLPDERRKIVVEACSEQVRNLKTTDQT